MKKIALYTSAISTCIPILAFALISSVKVSAYPIDFSLHTVRHDSSACAEQIAWVEIYVLPSDLKTTSPLSREEVIGHSRTERIKVTGDDRLFCYLSEFEDKLESADSDESIDRRMLLNVRFKNGSVKWVDISSDYQVWYAAEVHALKNPANLIFRLFGYLPADYNWL